MKLEKLLLSLALLTFAGCATYNKNPTTTYESNEDASVSRIAGGDNKTKNILKFENNKKSKIMKRFNFNNKIVVNFTNCWKK